MQKYVFSKLDLKVKRQYLRYKEYVTQRELMRLFEGDIKNDILIQHIVQYLRNILTPKQFSYHIPIKSYR